jgi:hypothetical protein
MTLGWRPRVAKDEGVGGGLGLETSLAKRANHFIRQKSEYIDNFIVGVALHERPKANDTSNDVSDLFVSVGGGEQDPVTYLTKSRNRFAVSRTHDSEPCGKEVTRSESLARGSGPTYLCDK